MLMRLEVRYQIKFHDQEAGLIQNYVRSFPDRVYIDKVSYSDYSVEKSLLVPKKIIESHENDEFFSENIYTIKNLKINPEKKYIPMLGRDFGLVEVSDSRFKRLGAQSIQYMAHLTLPDDEKVVEWLADPIVLQNHNRSLKAMKN